MDQISNVLTEAWVVFMQMSPYLLLGFLIAGVLSEILSPEWIEKHLGQPGIGSVIKASLFGIPLPLCSCGVIPVSASLRRHGASKGATASFLLSTPQTGVDSIAVTWALLGPVFTLFRPVAAFVTGVVGGLLIDKTDSDDMADNPEETSSTGNDNTADTCCAGNNTCTQDAPSGTSRFANALRYGFVTLPADIAKPMLAGILIAGLIAALVPDNTLKAMVGDSIGGMFVMMLFGLPLYVCATASVPIASALWLHQGISPGAALVFLITGPATNAATIGVVWRVLGKKSALIYLGTVAFSAVLSGLLLDSILAAGDHPLSHSHDASATWWTYFEIACAVSLLLLLINALRPKTSVPHPLEDAKDSHVTTYLLEVSGMTCSHCASSVTRALEDCAGVKSADVNHESGRAIVNGDVDKPQRLCTVVSSLGYTAKLLGISKDGDTANLSDS